MAKSKQQKKELLESYKSKVADSKGFIVLKPSKLTPNEVNELKKELYDFGSSFNVVKNSIFKLALKDKSIEIPELDKGEYSILFMNDDFVAPAKRLKKFVQDTTSKDGDVKIQVIAGFLEDSVLSKNQVEELSEMPDFKGSIALILGVLDMAMSGVVNVLEDAPRSMASILDQAFKE
jgi:large subunit ribosomal protein L10